MSSLPEPVERYAAAVIHLAQAAGAEAANLGEAVGAVDRPRSALPDANPVWLPADAGIESVRSLAGVLGERGAARALCHVPEGAAGLRDTLEAEGFFAERLLVATLPPGGESSAPAGFEMRAADSDRDRIAWEQIVVEALAEIEEPASRAAGIVEWLSAAGCRFHLGTQQEAPAVAAAVAAAGNEPLVAVLVERPAMRRRGLALAALAKLSAHPDYSAVAGLLAAFPWEGEEFPGGLHRATFGGTILRFALEGGL